MTLFICPEMEIMKPIYYITIKYNDEWVFGKKYVTGQRDETDFIILIIMYDQKANSDL